MRTQWTTKGNRDAGSSCSCDRGLHRYTRIWNFGGGVKYPKPPLGTPLARYQYYAMAPTGASIHWNNARNTYINIKYFFSIFLIFILISLFLFYFQCSPLQLFILYPFLFIMPQNLHKQQQWSLDMENVRTTLNGLAHGFLTYEVERWNKHDL